MVGGSGGDGGAAQREAQRKAEQRKLDSEIRARFFQPNNSNKVQEFSNPSRQFGIDAPVFRLFSGDNGVFQFDDDAPLTEERQASLAGVERDVRNRFVPDFNELTNDATRELDFALARRGLFGGSAQTDAEGRLDRRISKGEEDIASRVVGARTQKESFDNDLLDSLLAQSAAGASRDTVLGNLTNRFSVGTNQAVNDATTASLVNPFTNVGSLFKNINDSSQFTSGQTAEAARLAALLQGNSGGGTRGSQGTLS